VAARTVTLVRHGQTESSARMAYSGRAEIALTDTGREQALRCAAALAGAGIDAVRSSPLVRARDTAQAIADTTGAPLSIDERLVEIDYGPFEGLDRAGARERFGQAFDDWRADPFGSPVPGMETLPAALARASAATAEALRDFAHPVLVGHQGILRIVLIALGELAPQDYFSRRLQEAEPVTIARPAIVRA
jgi:broad specificity phosphatase PhoE